MFFRKVTLATGRPGWVIVAVTLVSDGGDLGWGYGFGD